MSETLKLSSSAFSAFIPSVLTNEIPHLSTFDIINSQLKVKWVEELVGTTSVDYEERDSKKTVNGVVSSNYANQEITYIDPSTSNTYIGSVQKPNFTVTGAWETEMDYLMHENARYLSKLYPEDINSLTTLTDSERQSYFNEALHMLHSYFDTSVIQADADSDDTEELLELYFKNKFIRYITPIRSLTGSYKQEDCLLQLLATKADIQTISGYTVMLTNDKKSVYSFIKTDASLEQLDISFLYTYLFYSDTLVSREFSGNIRAKTTFGSSASLLESAVDNVDISAFLSNAYTFKVVNLDTYEELMSTITTDLNNWFSKETLASKIKAGATVADLAETDFAATDDAIFSAYDTTSASYGFYWSKKYTQLIGVDTDTPTTDIETGLQNKYVMTYASLSDYEAATVIKFSTVSYSDTFKTLTNKLCYKSLLNFCNSDADSSFAKNLAAATAYQKALVVTLNMGDNAINCLISPTELSDFYESPDDYECGTDLVQAYEYPEDVSQPNTVCFEKGSSYSCVATFTNVDYDVTVPDVDSVFEYNGYKYILYSSSGAYFMRIIRSYEYTKLGQTFVDEDITKLPVSKLQNASGYSAYLIDDTLTVTHDVVKDSTTTSQTFSFLLHQGNNENKVYLKSDTTTVLGYSLQDTDNLFYSSYSLEKLEQQTSAQITARALTTSTFTTTIVSNQSTSEYAPVLVLNLDTLYNLTDIFEAGLVYGTKQQNVNGAYVTATKTDWNKQVPDESISANSDRDTVFFKKVSGNAYECATYKCEFIAADLVRIEEDIVETVERLGRIRAVLFNAANESSIVTVKAAYYQDEYIYLKLEDEDLLEFYKLADTHGFIVLDFDVELKEVENLESTDLEASTLRGRSAYSFNNSFVYKYTWSSLSRENLNFALWNIDATNPAVFSATSDLGQLVSSPVSLTETGNLTVCDVGDSLELKDIFEELLTENKSLYLTSILRYIRRIPLVKGLLIYSPQYQAYSYCISDTVPYTSVFLDADISKVSDDFSSLVDAFNSDELSISEISTKIERTKMIWGSVVWDANITKTQKTIRTIWSGYLAQFEIQSQADILPSCERVLLSASSESSQDLTTVNYAYNDGNPIANYQVAFSPAEDNSTFTVTPVTAFTFTNQLDQTGYVKDSKGNTVFLPTAIYKGSTSAIRNLNSFYLSLNSWNTDTERFEISSTQVGVDSITFNSTRNLYLAYTDKISVKYDSDNQLLYGIKSGDTQKYRFRLVYNYPQLSTKKPIYMLFDKSTTLDDESLEISDALNFFLEYITYAYAAYLQATKNGTDLTSLYDVMGVASSTETVKATYKALLYELNTVTDCSGITTSLDLSDILSFAYTYISNNSIEIPAICILNTTTRKMELHYFQMEKDTRNSQDFVILENYVELTTVPVFLQSLLLQNHESFTVDSTDVESYLEIINSKVFALPSVEVNGVLNTQLSVENTVDENSDAYLYSQIDNSITSLQTNLVAQTAVLTETDKAKINDSYYISLYTDGHMFKDYTTNTIQLGTVDSDDKTDIKDCYMQFTEALPVTTGNIRLYNIRATDKRARYATAREIQIVDRSYTLTGAKFSGYRVVSANKVQLVIDDADTLLSDILTDITPTDTTVNEQPLESASLTMLTIPGDPGVSLGYTFYKRKFITEVDIDSDAKTLTLYRDQDLDFTDHVAVGDNIQLLVLDAVSGTSDTGTALIDTKSNKFAKSGRVIYVETTTSGIQIVQSVIVSTSENLIHITTNLTRKTTVVDKALDFPANLTGVYAFAYEGYIYAYDKNKQLYMLTSVADFVNTKSLTNSLAPDVLTASEIPEVDNYITELTSEHEEWFTYYTDGSTKVTTYTGSESAQSDADLTTDTKESTPIATKVIDTIPLEDREGMLVFDSADRVAFYPDDSELSASWSYTPDAIEEFTAPIVVDQQIFDPDAASLDELKTYIYTVLYGSLIAMDTTVSDSSQLESTASATNSVDVSSDNGSWSQKKLAQYLTNATTGIIQMQNFHIPGAYTTMDVPVYLGDGQVKYKAVTAIDMSTSTANTATIENAELADLITFAKVLKASGDVYRENQSHTSWTRDDTRYALLDTKSATLTITDILGHIKSRTFLPVLGYAKPYACAQDSTESDVNIKASRLYFKSDSTTTLDTEHTITAGGESYGIYTWLKDTRISTVAKATFGDVDWNAIVDAKAAVDLYAEDCVDLVSFRNPDDEYSWRKLSEALVNTGDSTLTELVTQINGSLVDTSPAEKVQKGTPYFNYSDSVNYSDLCSVGLTNIADNWNISSSNNDYCWQSLVDDYQGLKIRGDKVYIYGTLKFPRIDAAENTLLANINTSLVSSLSNRVLSESDTESNTVTEEVSVIVSDVKQQLTDLYEKMGYTVSDYESSTEDIVVGFMLTYDITTGLVEITNPKLTVTDETGTYPIQVISVAGSNNVAFTTNSYVTVPSDVSSLTNSDATYTNFIAGNLLMLDAIKATSPFVETTVSVTDANLYIGLRSISYRGPTTTTTRVLQVTADTIKLQQCAFVPDGSSTSRAIIYVTNKKKDNFQFSYGLLDYVNELFAIDTVFEVSSEDYADFATYKNSRSSDTTYIYDIYPKWSEIDDDKKSNFYTLDTTESITATSGCAWLENSYGRKILRIDETSHSPITSITTGTTNVSYPDYYSSDATNNVLSAETLYQQSYASLVAKYKLYYVPALVTSPRNAMTTKPTTSKAYDFTDGRIFVDGSVCVLEGTVKTEVIQHLNSYDMAVSDRNTQLATWKSEGLTDYESFTPLTTVLSLDDIALYIENTTANYPVLKPITDFEVTVGGDSKDTVIKTTAYEMYIPSKGYGQSLLGAYTTPENCNFADGSYYYSDYNTVNSDGKVFVLVNKDITPYSSTEETKVVSLAYESYEAADKDLSTELATKEELELNEVTFSLDDLASVTSRYALIQGVEQLDLIELASAGYETTSREETYALFVNSFKFSCSIMLQDATADTTTDQYEDITSKETIKDNLGYDRLYFQDLYPCNCLYVNSKSEYALTTSSYPKAKNIICANSSGEAYYLNKYGELTTSLTDATSDALPGISFDYLLTALENLDNIFTDFIIRKDGSFTSAYTLSNCLQLCRVCTSLDETQISFTTSDVDAYMLWIGDPADLTFIFTQIGFDSVSTDLSFSLSTNLSADNSITLKYKTQKNKKYNFVYLKDKNDEAVAKIYFEEPIDYRDLLLVCLNPQFEDE